MGKNNTKGSAKSAAQKPITKKPTAQKEARRGFLFPMLPIPLVVFLLVWLWAAWWQGDVFRMVRENSFFAFDNTLMNYELQHSYGYLWAIGRCLLTTFRYPVVGGFLLALLLTSCCWMLGYTMRLRPAWRWVEWLPLGVYVGVFTYQGLNNWFEAESGQAMGIPFAAFVVLSIWTIIIRSFSRHPKVGKHPLSPCRANEGVSRRQNAVQALFVVLMLAVPMGWASCARPYVRPLASMQVDVMNQNWNGVIKTAQDNAELSYRPMAAQYIIALVQTGQQCEKLFEMRLDYDSLYITGMNGDHQNATNIYLMECDYHAGLVQAAYHHAMENMAMVGPTIRNLKMLCKTALLRSEWALAEKYLYILDQVPFEGDFVTRYRAMLNNPEAVNADPEVAMVRLTEPIHDNFENNFVQPVFLGYTAALVEGRSINALWNSLMVNIYTKTMPEFIFRSQAIQGTTPPKSIAEALCLMANKQPELANAFNGLEMHRGRLGAFIRECGDMLKSSESRAQHARELFPKYKGYYPYYYFFGNLKATRKSSDKKESSNSGVN
ncbi:MAG: hypothetical protein KBT12_01030 [Bacteroidales bacterium]|nr:hypothetical protein [Candidatus Physcousia equi]